MIVLLACSGMPESIPRQPGVFSSAEQIDRLLVAANPDNLVALKILPDVLASWADPSCPAVEEGSGLVLYEGGCTDMYGGSWHGSAERFEGDRDELSADGFGVTLSDAAVGIDGLETQLVTWLLDGRYASWTEDGEQRFDARLAIDYTDERDAVLVWIDVEGIVGTDAGFATIPEAGGTVGLERWGTAGLAVEDVASGWFSGCAYPALGSLALHGENSAALAFGDPDPTCAPCPTTTVDGEPLDVCDPWFHLQLPGS